MGGLLVLIAVLAYAFAGFTPLVTDGTPERVVVDDPELIRLVAAWPRLPEAVKRGILAMIRAME